ncbi:Sec-independent protein translocase TatB [Microbacterium deminutum]|uniref:Sec-independent protein translocase TatB n=1 Tax=Microbacterium deminutum TaxID=344164 RepID=A0ABN2R5R6_9MICO
MFGFSFEKFLVIAVFAILILGPERLPAYAAKLATLVTALRRMTDGAKERMRDEVGPDFDDVDWKKLDPRQYDPRHIIRQALFDEPSAHGEAPDGPTVADVETGRGPAGPVREPSQSP